MTSLFYKIYIGDSEEVMKSFDSNSVGLAVTSPPYFVMRDTVKWSSYDNFLDKMEAVFKEVYRVLRANRVFVLNVPDAYIYKEKDYDIGLDLYYICRKKLKFNIEEIIIWKKPLGMKNAGGSKRFGNFIKYNYPFYYKPDRVYEFIFVLTAGSKMTKPHMGYKHVLESKVPLHLVQKYACSNVWELGTSSQDNPWDIYLDDSEHTAMYPEILSDLCIKLYSYVGDLALDPFLGSGTTMISARKNQRSCIGIDMKESLLPLIKKKTKWGQDLDPNVKFEVIK